MREQGWGRVINVASVIVLLNIQIANERGTFAHPLRTTSRKKNAWTKKIDSLTPALEASVHFSSLVLTACERAGARSRGVCREVRLRGRQTRRDWPHEGSTSTFLSINRKVSGKQGSGVGISSFVVNLEKTWGGLLSYIYVVLFRRSARIDCLAFPLIRLNHYQVVALETAGSGITCNAVCPGWVLTPLVQKQIETRAAQAGHSVRFELES